MPAWTPAKRWDDGPDAFIIGGGPSLFGFDWSLLRGAQVIGCNAAFKLGVDVCPITFFADRKWFVRFHHDLDQYAADGGEVFTHNAGLHTLRVPYLGICKREHHGLHRDALGFGGNSGCSAVNLALILGASRVFLLGFDCRAPQPASRSHWHEWRIETPRPVVFQKFLQGWGQIALSLPRVFPGAQIINLTPDSAIPYFPKHSFEEFFPCAQPLMQLKA